MSEKEILNDMLSTIDDTVDKSEGSYVYDVLAAASIELNNILNFAEKIQDKAFVDTAEAKNLDRIVNQIGIKRKEATFAEGYVTVSGDEGATITKGQMCASEKNNYIFQENKKIDDTGEITVFVKCETAGTTGNVPAGAIKYFPKTIMGLTAVTNKEAIENGYNIESDESLRERYYIKIRTPATSGNKFDYLNWALNVSGVGNAKVIPIWNGPGTVKVIILDENMKAASTELINSVKKIIEEKRPVGAEVTVTTATEKSINITANISLEDGYYKDSILQQFKEKFNAYLKEIAFDKNYVSLARTGVFLLDIEGVIDYSELKLNNEKDNVIVGPEEVAILGEVTLNE